MTPPPIPGQWYVIYDAGPAPPGRVILAGPFATRAEAEAALALTGRVLRRTAVWQCPPAPPGRPPPP